MTLYAAIDAFLAFKRALGAKYSAESRILRSFGRTIGDIGLDAIQPDAVREFCRGSGALTQWHVRKHYVLRGFFRHGAARGHIEASPLPERPPRVPRSFRPRIYTPQELARLLDATSILHSDARPLRQQTYRTLLLVLYGAGLRPGEGLRLRLCDFDLDDRLLFVWDTKFFKSRIVPTGRALAEALATYRRARRTLPLPSGEMSRFFASPRGGAISLASLEAAWVRLREHANVRNPPQAHWQPRPAYPSGRWCREAAWSVTLAGSSQHRLPRCSGLGRTPAGLAEEPAAIGSAAAGGRSGGRCGWAGRRETGTGR